MKPVWKWLIALALALVVGVVVVVDRAAVVVAERQVVADAEENTDVVDATLEIHGFPFLTQAARGELGDVRGSAATATFGDLTVTDVRIEARNVATSSPHQADSITASAAIPIASLRDAAQIRTGLGPDLPTGFTLDSVRRDGDTLRITVTGRDVSMADLVSS
jgi:hypothetical protein